MTADAPGRALPRPTLHGSRHAISSGHYLASAAGFAILEAGGNAVDAGCAAGIALAVICADEVNFAGVAPIMIRRPDGKAVTIAGLGHWPGSVPADLFMRDFGGTMPEGIHLTVVPAAPDAWVTALRDFGTMSFGDAAAAAIRIARDGFAVYDYLAGEIAANAASYARWAANAEIFLPGGRPPAVGDRFYQRDLAAMLDHMVEQERGAAGSGREAGLAAARAAFYVGDIARRIAEYHAAHGGYLTRADLAGFQSRYEPVVRTRWRDFELLTCGPWCQGPVLAQALVALERAGLAATAFDDPRHVHLVLEVMKGAFADREYRYGDPAFVAVGLEELLSTAHADARLAAIDAGSATPGMPDPIGSPIDRALHLSAPSGQPASRARDTSYVCVVDRHGTAFSATPSDGSYACPLIPGLGIVPSERGMQSRPDPRHPSGVAPGKRPRLTPNPAIAVRDDGSILTIGCPGGDMQVQAMLQVILNAFQFGMGLQEAIDAPRYSTWSFPNSFAPFEYLPGRVCIEDRFGDALPAELERLGHDVVRWPAFTRSAAAVEAIYADAHTGFLHAGADPRQPASAIVA